jgi:hypothetical protein
VLRPLAKRLSPTSPRTSAPRALGNGILKALQTLGDLTGKLGDVLSKIDWVGLGITVGKQAVPFAVGLAAGILDFDPVQLFKGIMAHWADILFAVLAIAFAPAKVVGKVGEILARIPLAGKFLEWGLNAFKKLGDGFKGWIWDALKFMGREFLSGFRRIFPNVGSQVRRAPGSLPPARAADGPEAGGEGPQDGRRSRPRDRQGHRIRAARDRRASGPDAQAVRERQHLAGQARRRGPGGPAAGDRLQDGRRPEAVARAGWAHPEGVGDMSRVLYNAGAAVIEGLWNGISSKLSWLGGKLGGVGSFIKDHQGTKISNLMSTRSGFLGTFQSDSIFGTDMSAGGDIGSLIAAQQGQAGQASQLLSDVKSVTKMGLSKALVRQLRSQGTSGAAALHAIAMGSPDQIRQLNQLNKQTSESLRAAGLRAGNYARGGSINDDIRTARKQEHVLELLEHRLHELAQTQKKDQTIIVEIDGEALIKAVRRRNTRKGVKSANL